LKDFCSCIENRVVYPISNPVNYKRVLDNWNLLNTIASTFEMFFEGDLKKYTSKPFAFFNNFCGIEALSYRKSIDIFDFF
jgi:hypothetical protein